MSTKFFCVPNLAVDKVTASEKPWEDFPVEASVFDLDKSEYKKRWDNPATEHCLFHLAEGRNPDYVVSVGNEARALHGFVADYDGILTDDLIEEIQSRPLSRKFRPTYWCKSQSGKLHLVWMFERPFTVASNAHANRLIKIVATKVKAVKWGVGYDPSCEHVLQLMDIGREWHEFRNGMRLPNEEVVLWDTAIFLAGVRDIVPDAVDIDIHTVAEEVKRREWPQQPPLDFTVGKRCIRFWDPSADNVTGAQIVKDGIRVYTPHDNGFKSWRSLLGAEWTEQYVAHSSAPFLEDTFYCHVKDDYWRFFRNDVPPHYEKRTEKILRRDLQMEARLDPRTPRDGGMSEMDRVLYTITRKNVVDSVCPLIFRKSGRIYVKEMGKTVLNTSTVTVVKPAPRMAEFDPEAIASAGADVRAEYRQNPSLARWDNPFAVVNFPHIHRFLTALFMERQGDYDKWADSGYPIACGSPKFCDAQLSFLLSWMAHFYKDAASFSDNHGRGQALILCGPKGTGKSFFANVLMNALMGGATDGSKMLLEGSKFTSSMIQYPVLWVDDKLGSRSQKDRLRFTESLKIIVANASMRYEAKFGHSEEAVPWPGRVIIISNDDAQSMSVLPDLDMSTRDKFMMLKLGGAHFRFSNVFAENKRWLHEELPFFANFLLHWDIPEPMRDDRFGVRAIQHADMAQASAENGLTQVTLEVLETCIESVAGQRDGEDAGDRGGFVVEGNAVKVFKWIQSVDPALGREVIDSRTLQASLSTLYKNGGYNIQLDEGTKRWRIPYDLRRRNESSPLTPNTGV